eukprot:g3661.t1
MEPHPPASESSAAAPASRHGQLVSAAAADGAAAKPAPAAGAGFHRQKKPTLDEVVESVFQSVTGEYGEAKGIDIPGNFYEFYEDPLFRHFLACIVYYYFGYVDLRKLEDQVRRAAMDDGDPAATLSTSQKVAKTSGAAPSNTGGGVQRSTDGSTTSASIHAREIHYSQIELRRRLRLVGEAYSRLLLNCSNFEHTSEDKRFFEFVFEFTRSVTRLAIDKKYWDDMEGSLSYLFRGYMFNNPALRSRDLRHDARARPADGAGKNLSGDGSDGAAPGLDEEEDSDAIIAKEVGDSADAANALQSNRRDGKGKALEPIELARRTLAKYRSRITGAPRAREIRARRRLRKMRLREAATNDISTGLLPPEVVHVSAMHREAIQHAHGNKRYRSNHGRDGRRGLDDDESGVMSSCRDISGLGARRSMQSVREIINARSPLVSLLFPTPMESAAQNQLFERAGKFIRKKKRAVERAEKEKRDAEWTQAQSMLPTPRGEGSGSKANFAGAKGRPAVRGATGAMRTGKVVYNSARGRPRKKRGAALFGV